MQYNITGGEGEYNLLAELLGKWWKTEGGREEEGAIQRQHRLQQMGLGVMLRQADGHRERQSRRGDSGYVSELSYDGRITVA
jgi:hypothetical protein